ncbi:GNAT family N-acetyltransferase [Streptomyces zaomyceticus]|uniref:GNAT family N-acetyltransferase n=1 Tax=Streptomyces zaomyceticus TaxID=68286 RepID=UPI003673FDD3
MTEVPPQLANCRDYWLEWGAEGRKDEDFTYYRSGVQHPQLNGVLRLRSKDKAGVAVERAAELLDGVPWMWWVGPDSAPGVADELVKRGARKVGEMPVMALRMDAPLKNVDGPTGLRVVAADGREGLDEWVQTYSPSFGVLAQFQERTAAIEAGRADGARVVRFIGRLDGEAVGTALMLEAHGVAGIYVVTTSEAHRRQGIGAALTTAALRAGQERGLRVGTLQASPLGASVYRRMGFENVATYDLFQIPTS